MWSFTAACRFLKRNGSNLGICLDCNHFLTTDCIEFINALGEYIVTTHLSDYDGIDERHWIPGEGMIDWKKLTCALKEKGYTGPYIFEVNFKNRDCPTDAELQQLEENWSKLMQNA